MRQEINQATTKVQVNTTTLTSFGSAYSTTLNVYWGIWGNLAILSLCVCMVNGYYEPVSQTFH